MTAKSEELANDAKAFRDLFQRMVADGSATELGTGLLQLVERESNMLDVVETIFPGLSPEDKVKVFEFGAACRNFERTNIAVAMLEKATSPGGVFNVPHE